MRLTQVRVQNYRCIRDTGWFDVEQAKTILVGPNEAGKTAVLEALQQINRPDDVKGFNPLRDYPRKLYNVDIQSQKRDPSKIPVASARFALEPEDLAELSDDFAGTEYVCVRYLNNTLRHWLEGGPEAVVFSEEVRKDLRRLAVHVERHAAGGQVDDESGFVGDLDEVISDWQVVGQPGSQGTGQLSYGTGSIRPPSSWTRMMQPRTSALAPSKPCFVQVRAHVRRCATRRGGRQPRSP